VADLSLNDEYWCWDQVISSRRQAEHSYMVATATDLLLEQLVAFWSFIAFLHFPWEVAHVWSFGCFLVLQLRVISTTQCRLSILSLPTLEKTRKHSKSPSQAQNSKLIKWSSWQWSDTNGDQGGTTTQGKFASCQLSRDSSVDLALQSTSHGTTGHLGRYYRFARSAS
jgi:hypothetical protein